MNLEGSTKVASSSSDNGTEGNIDRNLNGNLDFDKEDVIQSINSEKNMDFAKAVKQTNFNKLEINVDMLKVPFIENVACKPATELIVLEKSDFSPMEESWGYCLAGVCLGRFPGYQAIEEIANSWPSKPRVACHSNGVSLFRFKNREAMLSVYERGPYSVFGRPLILHLIDPKFTFDSVVKKDVKVWVSLPNLPLELWNPMAMGKILSRIGKPIMMDTHTYQKKKPDYARVLVEIDPSIPPPVSLDFLSYNNDIISVAIDYDFVPKFCSNCNRYGHYKDQCQGEKVVTQNKEKTESLKQMHDDLIKLLNLLQIN